jgi:hypothetical protein
MENQDFTALYSVTESVMFYLVWWVRLNTTYGENIGVMAITGVYSVWVIRGAALWQSFFGCRENLCHI